jgi:transcriptional regulator with XRE-family HTH domain
MRSFKGLTQVKLAAKAGIQQSSLSDIETGETNAKDVKAPTLSALAKALGTNPGYLLTGKETPVEPQAVTVEESELLAIYRQLGPWQQASLIGAARGMIEATPPTPSAHLHRPNSSAPQKSHK